MDRRVWLLGSLALLAAPLAAEAQPPGRAWRIGVLLVRDIHGGPELFRQRLRDLGYIEGQNIVVDWRRADEGSEQLPDLAAELVRLRPDVIVADVTPAIHAAMRATKTIPIVMAIAADPVGNGLVSNLARPSGNVTGVSLMLPDIGPKRLQLLRDALPTVSRVAVLWNPSIPWHTLLLRELDPVAPSLGLQLLAIAVEAPGEFEGAFSRMARGRVDVAFVGDSPIFTANRKRLLELAAKHRLPMIFGSRDMVAAGALMSYGPNFSDMFGHAAAYVARILKGAKPADLPVQQPTKFELVFNLKTAKALGLTIPPSMLARADELIQ